MRTYVIFTYSATIAEPEDRSCCMSLLLMNYNTKCVESAM